MYCEKCGSKISAGDRFCEKCGSPVTQTEQGEQEKHTGKPYKGLIIGGVTVCIGIVAIAILFGMGVIGGGDKRKKPDDIAASQSEATPVIEESLLVNPESEVTAYPEWENDKENRFEPEEEDSEEEFSEEDFEEEFFAEEYEDEFSDEDFSYNTPEEAYSDYWRLFINAVNTGKTMDLLIVLDGKCHEQQCAVAKSFHKRGIREELQWYSISSVKEVNEKCVKITAKEKIKVYYSDGSKKIVKQKYRYTLKLLSHKWYITNMNDLPW